MYDTGYNKEYGNMVFDDVCLLVRKKLKMQGIMNCQQHLHFGMAIQISNLKDAHLPASTTAVLKKISQEIRMIRQIFINAI